MMILLNLLKSCFMKKITFIFKFLLFASVVLLSACNDMENRKSVDTQPAIFPDYIGVTVPTNIAPLTFTVQEAEDVYAELWDIPGGKIEYGEKTTDGIKREVFEETGVKMEIDRLGFVHENYFYGNASSNRGKLIYEISFYFYMKVPRDFAPVSESFAEDDSREHLSWVSLDEDVKMYPEFFRTELKTPANTVKHFIKDERK